MMRLTASRRFSVAFLIIVGWLVAPVFTGASPQTPPQTVRVGGDVKPPQKTRDVKPAYPQYAVDHRTQGVVIMDVTIGTDGKVKDEKVVRGLPYLTDAAFACVRAWEFKPTMVDGHPVQVIMTIPINFVLQ
jgi:protein TonB